MSSYSPRDSIQTKRLLSHHPLSATNPPPQIIFPPQQTNLNSMRFLHTLPPGNTVIIIVHFHSAEQFCSERYSISINTPIYCIPNAALSCGLFPDCRMDSIYMLYIRYCIHIYLLFWWESENWNCCLLWILRSLFKIYILSCMELYNEETLITVLPALLPPSLQAQLKGRGRGRE